MGDSCSLGFGDRVVALVWVTKLYGCDSDDDWINQHQVTVLALLLGENKIIINYIV